MAPQRTVRAGRYRPALSAAAAGQILWDQVSRTLVGCWWARGGGQWMLTGRRGWPRRRPSRRSWLGSVRTSTSPRCWLAHYEQMARYFADYGHVATEPGELCYLAVDANEPSGKPILACRKVQVRLELAAVEDHGVLRDKGLAAMRQQRLAPLARQAQVQGGLLTVEDLAYLTCSSPATVK